MTEVDCLLKRFNRKAIDKFEYMKVDRPMDNEEIAERMGVTHQWVLQSLKSGIAKIYTKYRKTTDLEPFDICMRMTKMFGIPEDLDEEIKSFIKSFPKEIKGEILRNAEKRFRN